MSDIYFTGILPNSQFRISLIDCSEICSQISRIHNLDPRMMNFLSKTLMGAFFISRMVKGEQRISIQWKDEFKQSVLAYSNRLGQMKGVAYPSEFPTQDIRNDFILGTGIMKVIRWRIDDDPYTSFTNLIEDTFENNLVKYIQDSEQIHTKVYMDSSHPKIGFLESKGLFLQALPESTEKSQTKVIGLADKYFLGSSIWEKHINEIYMELSDIFSENIQDLDSGKPKFQCDCSRLKISEVLVSLGYQEIDRILNEEGRVEVECEFCKSIYDFDRTQSESLFSKS